MTLEGFLYQTYGFNRAVTENWRPHTQLWRSWYKGKVANFHDYSIYNGKRRVRMERLSLQMAKKCCEDWADLLFNERCRVSVANDSSQKALLTTLARNDFWSLVNHAIESAGALGTGAFVVSVDDLLQDEFGDINSQNAYTRIQFVDIDGIYPISWDGKRITECAFAARTTIKNKPHITLSVHLLEDGRYKIHNHLFEDGNSLREVEGSAISVFDTGSSVKWFSMLSPSGVNQILPNSPWGVPFFANAIDTLKAIDTAYDSLNNEIQLGRKRIFARQEMFNVSPNGIDPVFDENDISIYVLPKGATADDLIQPENSELRIRELKQAIELNLMLFGSLVGFGESHFRESPNVEQTATAVISQNSAMFRRKKKHETSLEGTLYDLLTAVGYASTVFGIEDISTDGLTIMFDDSVAEDRSVLSERALREKQAGVLSPVEYRQRVYGETEEIARLKIEEIKNDFPTLEYIYE